jgi:uncharacterized protein YndB with AHSA1/START domain
MRWILIVLVVLAVGAALVALVGSRLPQLHVASRQASYGVPPEVVWAAITNVEAFGSWRTDIKRVERLPDRDGRPMWIEDGRSGKMTLAVERMVPPRLLVLRIADPQLPFGGTWTYVIDAAPSGSRLTITENGEIYNPIFRFMARFIFGYDGTINSYLAALEKKFRAPAEPRAH